MRRFLRTLLLAVDAALIAVFLAGYLAYHVRLTSFWWFELVAIVLPYIAGMVAVAACLALAARRWRVAAVHAILLLLLFVRANPFGKGGGDGATAGDTLTVLTYNVPRWWDYEARTKTEQMAELIDRADADLIALQEAPAVYYPDTQRLRAASHIRVLKDSLGYEVFGPDGSGPMYTPQPVFSRSRLVRQDEYRLQMEPEDTVYTHVTRSQVNWDGHDVAVYNVHLRTFGEKPWDDERLPFFESANLRPYLRQFRNAYEVRAWEIEQIIEMIEAEELPVILCGDLNSTPNNWVHGRLRDRLRDTFLEQGTGWGMTYHTRLPLVRIDFIFVSTEWEVVSARVLDADLSDHLPVLVKLRLTS